MIEMDVVILNELDIPIDKTMPRSEFLLRRFRNISGNPNGKLAVVRWKDGTQFCAWILGYKVRWQITTDRICTYHYPMSPPERGTRDQMIDIARDRFPNLFDLILFHPEILDGKYLGDKE